MRVSYCPDYWIPLPERHPFPMRKYPALRDLLLSEGLIEEQDVHHPEPCPWDDLARVHGEGYLQAVRTGVLDDRTRKALGFAWSERLVLRARRSVAGTVNAARMALEDGLAANLAGGTHHAFPDHGEGYCTFNDVAVAVRILQAEQRLSRVLIVDLDVHQGNGNAAMFSGDDEVFTFSVHGERNYPFRKVASDCDVGLPDGTRDDEYLAALSQHLPRVIDSARPELVFFLAGVDPHEGDRLGRLALTRSGLERRERCVLSAMRDRRLPVVILLAGGYGPTPEQTADLHAIAHRVASKMSPWSTGDNQEGAECVS